MAFYTADGGGTAGSYPACPEGYALSRKVYKELTPPSEGDTAADAERLVSALSA